MFPMETDIICISSDGEDSVDVPRKYNKGREVPWIKSEKVNSSLKNEDIIIIINDNYDYEESNKGMEPTWILNKKIDSSGSSAKSFNGSNVKQKSLNQSIKTKKVERFKNESNPGSNFNKRDSFDQSPKSVSHVINVTSATNDPTLSQSPIFKTGEVSILKRKIIFNDKIPAKRVKLTEVTNKELLKNGTCSPKPSTSKVSTLSISNENSSLSTSVRSSPTPGCSWYTEMEKPKLVVKERKVLYDDEFDLFSTFLQTCLKRDPSEDMKKIVKKLRKKHERLHPTFLNSDNFKQLLIDKQQMISNNEGKLFVHIQDVNDEMKNGAKRSRSLENNVLKTIKNADKDNEQKQKKEENELDEIEDRRKRKKLNTILNSIEVIKKRIKQLDEEEIDFDKDDNESSYIKVDKYKRKLMQLWSVYCKYSGEKVDAGRAYLRPKHISATLITQVDQAIMSFINSKISKRNELLAKGRSIADSVIFPDYLDIFNCIKKCNEKYNLELSKTNQEIKAKEAFIKIGEHLQRVRQTDYWDTFSLYLEEEDDDPALKDSTLAEKLDKNSSEGKKNMADILEIYTQKQECRAEELKKNGEVEMDDENDDDDGDNDEGEDNDDEKEEDDEDQEVDVDVREEENLEKDDKKDDDDHEIVLLTETDVPNVSKPTANNASKVDKSQGSPDPSTKDSSNVENDNLAKTSSSEAKDSSGDLDVIEVDDEGLTNSKKQPLLRLRSFAKPPTSWDDSLQSEGSPIIKGSKFATSTPKPFDTKLSKVPSGPTTVVDLTEISEKGETLIKPGIRKVVDPSYASALKGKFKTVVLPSNFKGKQFISVKNITNNYNVVNTPGKSVSPSGSKTFIRLPGQSISHINNPRKPVQVRVNSIPDEIQKKLIDKSSMKSTQILPKPSVKPIYYQQTSNPNVFTNPEGQTVRMRTIVPNPEAKVMKVLNLNETRKLSIKPLQTHRVVNKALMSPNNQLNPKKIQIGPRIDHQYSKQIVNNVVRIMKPGPLPGEQNFQSVLSDRLVKK